MIDLASWSGPANAIVLLFATGVVGSAGTKLAAVVDRLADRTGLGEAITGTVFLGMTTSLPGLSASVGRGIPTLAVGNVVGGNYFANGSVAASGHRPGDHRRQERSHLVIAFRRIHSDVSAYVT